VDLNEQLNIIEQKVQQVVEQLHTYRKENAVLLEQNKRLEGKLDDKDQLLARAIEKLTGIQRMLAQQPEGLEESSKASNSTVKQCLEELSQCIEWLKTA
jgi:predicted nuclease with TOPRIM domain